MNAEQTISLERRAAVHAALADVTRLSIVEILSTSDASSSELAAALDLPTNLLAHHLKTLGNAGLVARHRSEGDRRRTYLRLVPEAFGDLAVSMVSPPQRLVFVCTANSARSHLAAALWTQASTVPATSAGTHPADRVDPCAVATAARHEMPLLPDATPRLLAEVAQPGDLIVTVCDLAHEELAPGVGGQLGGQVHWSVPDPVPTGTQKAFDNAYEVLSQRVAALAPRVSAAS